MSFSNPAVTAHETGAAYVRALLALLGDRDPIAVMEELPEEVRKLTRGLSAEQLATPEKPGKWPIVAVVQHLADSEIVFGFRMRMSLSHDRPALTGIDQDLWSQQLRYSEVALDEALDQLRALRRANLRIAHGLTDQDRARVGMHAERGPESVGLLIQLMGGHDLAHRNQIRRIRDGFAW